MEIALLVVGILQLIVAVIGLVDLKTFDKIKKKTPSVMKGAFVYSG